ncbi:HATPase_c domain containing protein [uncultured Caudovirales phage]|uniref:HATPase_c domain containing protein n=1 Tax=uncultured Caudovirales phage TaxID=2100421 RepID=A0A6J7X1J5_9CAUD|nr:HATPase_c domain containing protein [uncultured Caudovirales phage]
MLMTREHETVQANGLGAGGAFTIAASAKAFEVLSSNLYQNKTLAVIREIACNAADAHRAAGLPISKIAVHLPTYSEMYFAVRDYGTGLSTDDVLSLYTTYFRSTKDKDNSQIGGFGLGSKSPFAVADQFTVTSWHGGMKTTFVCFKNNGTPEVNTVGSTPCGSETGLEVRVAVTAASGQPPVWQTEARRLFQWWPVAPKLNVPFPDGVPQVRDPANILLSSETMVDGLPAWSVYNSHEKTVVMGGVPYRLDLSAIPAFPETLTRVVATLGFHLALPIGTVNISPSREALSYDVPTCKALIAAVTTFAKHLIAGLEELVAKQPTLAAARELLYGVGSKGLASIYAKLTINNATIRWKGQPVHRQVTLDLTTFSTPGKMTSYEKRSYWTNFRIGAVSDNAATHAYFQASELVIVWTAKVTSKTYRTLKHNYGVGPAGRNRHTDIYIHLYHGMPYAELVARCEQLGIPKPINADTDLEEAPTNAAAGKTGRVHSTQYYTMTPSGVRFERELQTGTLDLTGGGIFIPMWEGHIHSDYRDVATHCAGLLYNGWMTKLRVIGISKTKLKDNSKLVKALAAHGWHVMGMTVVQDNILVPEIQKVAGPAAWRDFRQNMGTAMRTILLDGIRCTDNGMPWKGFHPVFDLMKPHFKALMAFSTNAPHLYYSYSHRDTLGILTPGQIAEIAEVCPPVDELKKVWQGFLAQHPLLKYIGAETSVDTAHLTDYFNR